MAYWPTLPRPEPGRNWKARPSGRRLAPCQPGSPASVVTVMVAPDGVADWGLSATPIFIGRTSNPGVGPVIFRAIFQPAGADNSKPCSAMRIGVPEGVMG